MGPAVVMAAGRRRRVWNKERSWAMEMRVDAFKYKLGFNLHMKGFVKLN
jgi:hypothetical protein